MGIKEEVKFRKLCRDIKTLKVQGASNIALAGLQAYSLNKDIKKILSLRETEPLLENALKYAKKHGIRGAVEHIEFSEKEIAKKAYRFVRRRVFTHCHSDTVVNALIQAKKKGKRIEVFQTETRPKLQGRITARQLSRAKIRVNHYVDSAAWIGIKKSGVVLLGADAVLVSKRKIKGVVNKIGSYTISVLAQEFKKPVYILADSWKFVSNVKLEERDPKEVWENKIRNLNVENPSFDIIPGENIKGIITEEEVVNPRKLYKQD